MPGPGSPEAWTRPWRTRRTAWITTEDLPHPANRVTVDRQGRIHLAKTYHNLEPHRRLLAKLKELMGPLGCHDTAIPGWSILDQRIPLAGVAHQSGTVRFGDNPKTSALDINCRAHDLDKIAAPTTLTTSTSWTRASSRPAAPSTRR
jgi:choline dehydrogenase-like flavoprotein